MVMEVRGVPDQCPAPAEGNGEAQTGEAVSEEDVAGGAGEGEGGTEEMVASKGALEQVLQVCEQDMSSTNAGLSDLGGMGLLTGK